MDAIGVSRRCTGSRRSNAVGHQRSVRGSRSVLVVNNVHFRITGPSSIQIGLRALYSGRPAVDTGQLGSPSSRCGTSSRGLAGVLRPIFEVGVVLLVKPGS